MSWVAWPIAGISVCAAAAMWFRIVQLAMDGVKSMVDSASVQLSVCRQRNRNAQGGADERAVLERSEDIYRQAVEHYNSTLHKPWNYLPGRLLGFRSKNCE